MQNSWSCVAHLQTCVQLLAIELVVKLLMWTFGVLDIVGALNDEV